MHRLVLLAAIALAAAVEPPPDDRFVVPTPDGHLARAGERQRFWGFIGFVVPEGQRPGVASAEERALRLTQDRARIDQMVQRIVDLGFNAIRLWEDPNLGDWSRDLAYAKDDGSRQDLLAYYLWRLDERGVAVWHSTFNNVGAIGADDVGVVDDAATADAWSAALRGWDGGKPVGIRGNLARFWDARIEALALKRMRALAEFPNAYKDGLRMCDDPQVYVWELANEELWLREMFAGRWQSLPAFLRGGLLARWHAFLTREYHDDAGLTAAWRFLLPGESLERGTVLLAPLANPVAATTAINDVNPAAAEALKVLPQSVTRDDVVRRRGEDVVRFLLELCVEHKRAETRAVKSWGKSCRLATTLWDCGNCYQIQSQAMFADAESGAVASCAYVSGMGWDPSAKRWPFWSQLDAPPRLCWDVPWLEQSPVVGKPHLVYETQIANQTKYRAEFPLRIAALAAVNDWDAINWHIYGPTPQDPAAERPFSIPLMVWHDYFGWGADEVQCAAMRVAGEAFRHGLLEPAAKPTTFVFGRRSLYAPESMDYGRSYGDLGKKFIPTAHRYGLRVRIDPTREDDAVEGPAATQGVFEPTPVRPSDEIAFDWNRGHLTFDAPAIAAYTGFFGQYGAERIVFADGAEFSAISVRNPDGIAFPVTPQERYVTIALASSDGAPLASCTRATLCAVSTSFNSGFAVDTTKGSRGMRQQGPDPSGPHEFFGAWVETGVAPVLVARVGCTVRHAGLAGMRWVARDWEMRDVAHGEVAGDGAFMLLPETPAFLVEFSR